MKAAILYSSKRRLTWNHRLVLDVRTGEGVFVRIEVLHDPVQDLSEALDKASPKDDEVVLNSIEL